MGHIFINGRILPEEEAVLSPYDRGFLFGDGLFETIKADPGGVYFLDRHLARLKEGADFLKIPFPDFDNPGGIIRELLNRNRLSQGAAVKICLTRGIHEGPLSLYAPRSSPTLLVMARPYHPPAPADWVYPATM